MYGVFLWDDENILKLTMMVMPQICEFTKSHPIVPFKWVSCMACEFYLHKAVIFFKTKDKSIQVHTGHKIKF